MGGSDARSYGKSGSEEQMERQRGGSGGDKRPPPVKVSGLLWREKVFARTKTWRNE